MMRRSRSSRSSGRSDRAMGGAILSRSLTRCAGWAAGLRAGSLDREGAGADGVVLGTGSIRGPPR